MMAPDPIPEDVGVQENMVFIKILPISGNISSDQTGQFPLPSIWGRKYIIFMADYESDVILAEPCQCTYNVNKENYLCTIFSVLIILYMNSRLNGFQGIMVFTIIIFLNARKKIKRKTVSKSVPWSWVI